MKHVYVNPDSLFVSRNERAKELEKVMENVAGLLVPNEEISATFMYIGKL